MSSFYDSRLHKGYACTYRHVSVYVNKGCFHKSELSVMKTNYFRMKNQYDLAYRSRSSNG